MKKPLLLFALMLMSTLAFGQIQKGDIQLGGNLNFIDQDNNLGGLSFFQLSPQGALLISETTSLGLSLGYSTQKIGTGVNEQKTNLFSYGAFVRFYKSMGEKFYLYLQPGINFGTGDINSGDITTFNLNVAPGLAYFLSDKIALEMNFGGAFYNSQKTNGTTTDGYGLNFTLSGIAVGASILLRK